MGINYITNKNLKPMKDIEQKDKEMKEFLQKICEMRTLAMMIENAPKDNKGQCVVNIVGIKDIGVFYQFIN
jgi:hypothetical protein